MSNEELIELESAWHTMSQEDRGKKLDQMSRPDLRKLDRLLMPGVVKRKSGRYVKPPRFT